MSDESQLQITRRDDESSLVLSSNRSDLVARGRRDAAMLLVPEHTDSWQETLHLAEQGNADAQFNLAVRYYDGKGVPQDYAEAARWIREAAEQGQSRAQFFLGRVYDLGQGVPQDYVEAARWLRKAADQGDADAQFNLGFAHYVGQGTGQDYAEAARWFREAAEQGNPSGQHWLGLLYAHGQGVQQGYVEAYEWLGLAAANSRFEYRELSAETRDIVAKKLTPEQLFEAERVEADRLERAEKVSAIMKALKESLGLIRNQSKP